MTEIKTIPYRDIKFTRDTKITEKTPIEVKTIFKKYDINGDGSFDDAEWSAYEKVLERQIAREKVVTNPEESVVKHYSNKIKKISKKYEKINQKWDKIDWAAVEKLEQFEKNHPGIGRTATNQKSEIPKGAEGFDAQAWEIGVYDEEKDCFTGEVCKYGYVIGLEKLSSEERKEYLKLLKNANKAIKEAENCRKELKKIDDEIDYYTGLEDMAKSGMLSEVGSREFEDKAYQQYLTIRNEANPFYSEIKSLEQKKLALWLKKVRTQEDENLIKQYENQIAHLQNASQTWSIGDSEFAQKVNSQGFSLTDLSEQVSYSSVNNETPSISCQDSQELVQTHSLGASYNGINWNVMGTFQKSEKYSFEPEKKFENTYVASLMAGYKREDFSVTSNSNLDINDAMSTYTQMFGFGYKKFNFNLSESIQTMSSSMQNEQGENVNNKQTSFSTTATLEHGIGAFTNSVSATFTKENIDMSLGSSAMFSKSFGKGFSYNVQPGMNATYSTEARNTSITPTINAGLNYQNQNGFNFGLNVSETYTASISSASSSIDSAQMNMSNNAKVDLTHDFTATVSVTPFKGFSGSLKFNDSDSSFQHSNTYGVELSYSTEKVGTFNIGYSYKDTKSKQEGCSDNGRNLVTFKYTAPLDWARSKKK